MNRKQLLIAVSIGMLSLGGFLFYGAYQLWNRYNEALDHFRRIAPHPPIFFLPTPDPTYVSYAERYRNFFIPNMIGATVTSAIAVTLIIYQTGRLKKNFAIIVVMVALVVGSVHSFYTAYQIWNRYQEATQTFSKSISIPNIFYIEDYGKFFIPYMIGGVVSVLVAATLFSIFFSQRRATLPCSERHRVLQINRVALNHIFFDRNSIPHTQITQKVGLGWNF